MIDEMMLVFDSPGSVSHVFIITLLPEMREGQTRATNNGKVPRGVLYALGRSELVGCGVRLGHRMPAASLQDESARAMPMPNNE